MHTTFGGLVAPNNRFSLRAVRELTDEELLTHLRDAGPDSDPGRRAAGELYARHLGTLMACGYRLTRDRIHAEDLVAEGVAKTLRAIQGGRGPQVSFVGYVLIAMRTEMHRSALRASRTYVMDPAGLSDLPQLVEADQSARVSEADLLANAFSTLTPRQQQVLVMLEIEGRSVHETAAHLRTNAAALRNLSFRARERLRTAYLQQHVKAAAPSCARYTPLLAAYVRKGLTKQKLQRKIMHLDECKDCQQQVRSLASINLNLHRLDR